MYFSQDNKFYDITKKQNSQKIYLMIITIQILERGHKSFIIEIKLFVKFFFYLRAYTDVVTVWDLRALKSMFRISGILFISPDEIRFLFNSI